VKKKLTVLLADDDKVQTLMLSNLLRARGFAVAAAYDATYAFMVAMKNPIDAIVLDIQMPGGTGLGVLERLRSSSKTMQIPVIVLTGSTDPATMDAVKALGADEYLSKPVNPERLCAALEGLLGISADGEPSQ
jgi:CheY-like chemotaxis protein